MDPPGVLLGSVSFGSLYWGSLRERSECPLRMEPLHQIPKICASEIHLHTAEHIPNGPWQGFLAPRCIPARGAAITRPRDATRAKMIKDLKAMSVVRVFSEGTR